MLLTNAQRGDVIDALKAAIDLFESWISSETIDGDPSTARGGDALDPVRVVEMLTQVKRWRALRRLYLAEERQALKDNVRKALRDAQKKKPKGGA